MNSFDKDRTLKVLNFWYYIDFLDQGAMPDQEFKTWSNKQGEVTSAHFCELKSSDIEVSSADTITTWVKKLLESEKLGSFKPSEQYLYVGRIKREVLVRYLAGSTQDAQEKLADREIDSMALALLKFDRDGLFAGLEVSPVIWAINQVKPGELNSEKLNDGNYRQFVAELCKSLACKKGEFLTLGSITKWSETISNQLLACLINANYLTKTDKTFEAGSMLLDFMAYRDERETDYQQSLTQSYFVNDIQEIKRAIKRSNTEELLNGPLTPLLKYVTAGFEDNDAVPPNSIDFLGGEKDGNRISETLNRILDMRNTPVGRWPSEYSLSLMQQTAVNLAVGRAAEPGCRGGDMMSVNGPPGTGKTTLLKDIIANSIVERARILASYPEMDPDEFFECVKFSHAEDYGGHYCYYAPKIFRLKDLRLKNGSAENGDPLLDDLGILVCSTNNTAVENVSKDISSVEELLGSLLDDDARGLYEHLEYFNEAAKRQFAKRDPDGREPNNDENRFLISARLGNKSNRGKFTEALFTVVREIGKDEERKEHLEQYKEARKDFNDQYELVEKLMAIHSALRKVAKLNWHCDELGDRARTIEAKALEEAWRFYEKGLFDFPNGTPRNLKAHKLECLKIRRSFEAELEANGKRLEAARREYDRVSSGPLARLRRKRVYEAEIQLIDAQKKQEGDLPIEMNLPSLNQHISALEQFEAEIGQIERQAEDIDKQIEIAKDEIIRAKKKIDEISANKESRTSYMQLVKKLESDFWPADPEPIVTPSQAVNLASLDDGLRSEAHLRNPASVEEIDRQRDMLMYYALNLLKEFVLSSNCMYSNLVNLRALWGVKEKKNKNDEPTLIKYHPEDRALAMEPILQSLFMLTPVVSTAFASVGRMMSDVGIGATGKAPFGLLVIDEAGQAVPYAALGAIARCRRSIVVGDPKQISPVVTSELDILRGAWESSVGPVYSSTSTSVQHLADSQNQFGGTISDESDDVESVWVGCPLLVHRRCISPMFDISNEVSYGGLMIQATRPENLKMSEDGRILSVVKDENSVEKEIDCPYHLPTSAWINVVGREIGDKNHYVPEQGAKALQILADVFERCVDDNPSIFIITPFKAVAESMRDAVKKAAGNPEHQLSMSDAQLKAFCDRREGSIGTVHTFQGKEADEVIFLLGCDDPNSFAAKSFVSKSIVNVAASRAKKRLYVIGDIGVWASNKPVSTMKRIIDRQWLVGYSRMLELQKELEENDAPNKDERKRELGIVRAKTFASLPTKDTLRIFNVDENGLDVGITDDVEDAFEVNIDSYLSNIEEPLEGIEITKEQCEAFNLESATDLEEKLNKCILIDRHDDRESVSKRICLLIKQGILLYYLFGLDDDSGESGIGAEELDASFCLINFCKAVELILRYAYLPSIKQINPNYIVRKGQEKTLKSEPLDSPLLTIGFIQRVIKSNKALLGNLTGNQNYDEEWWRWFSKHIEKFNQLRTRICHGDAVGRDACADAKEKLFEKYEYEDGSDRFGILLEIIQKKNAATELSEAVKNHPKIKVGESSEEPSRTLDLPRICKGTTTLQTKLNEIDELICIAKESGNEERIDGLKWQRDRIGKGLFGEKQVVWELETSGMPILILRDLFFRRGVHHSQIDVLVVTPNLDIAIECKNYSSDIEIDEDGCFYRYEGGEQKSFYSPIVQNRHHIETMKKLLDGDETRRIASLVVFSNGHKRLRKSPDATDANQVILIDQIWPTIERLDAACKDVAVDDKTVRDMDQRAKFWLLNHQEIADRSPECVEIGAGENGDAEEQIEQIELPCDSSAIPLSERFIVDYPNQQYRSMTQTIKLLKNMLFEKESEVETGHEAILELNAEKANELLASKGYISKNTPNRPPGGEDYRWGITQKGLDELGLVLLHKKGSFYCPGYPVNKEQSSKLIEALTQPSTDS